MGRACMRMRNPTQRKRSTLMGGRRSLVEARGGGTARPHRFRRAHSIGSARRKRRSCGCGMCAAESRVDLGAAQEEIEMTPNARKSGPKHVRYVSESFQ